MTPEYPQTDADVDRLFFAQAAHTAAMLQDAVDRKGFSDDGYDYISSALDVTQTLLSYAYDVPNAPQTLTEWLKGNYDETHQLYAQAPLFDHACDGICPELWAYHQEDDDDHTT